MRKERKAEAAWREQSRIHSVGLKNSFQLGRGLFAGSGTTRRTGNNLVGHHPVQITAMHTAPAGSPPKGVEVCVTIHIEPPSPYPTDVGRTGDALRPCHASY